MANVVTIEAAGCARAGKEAVRQVIAEGLSAEADSRADRSRHNANARRAGKPKSRLITGRIIIVW
jgi:hypothetical protein